MTSWTHEHSMPLPVPPDRVFRAFTDPADLKAWFAEDVEVVPEKGGAYRFWGRHTYGAPARGAADQRIVDFDPASALGFTWRFDGMDTRVQVRWAPKETPMGPGTTITVRHELPGVPAGARGKELIDDLWRLHFGNLGAHLMGMNGIVLPDFADPSPEIRMTISIDAPPEAVYRALLEPEALNRWIASTAEVEPKVGGRYTYGWKYPMDGREVAGGPTRILALEPNRKLVTDWPDWRGDASVTGQTITWLLDAEGSGTRLTLIHGGFGRTTDQSDYRFGWGGFATQLKSLVEAH